jgi:hypothetical protein
LFVYVSCFTVKKRTLATRDAVDREDTNGKNEPGYLKCKCRGEVSALGAVIYLMEGRSP